MGGIKIGYFFVPATRNGNMTNVTTRVIYMGEGNMEYGSMDTDFGYANKINLGRIKSTVELMAQKIAKVTAEKYTWIAIKKNNGAPPGAVVKSSTPFFKGVPPGVITKKTVRSKGIPAGVITKNGVQGGKVKTKSASSLPAGVITSGKSRRTSTLEDMKTTSLPGRRIKGTSLVIPKGNMQGNSLPVIRGNKGRAKQWGRYK